ncbi:MAG: hypothetical protein AAF108_09035 [Planctomycetota bacterium]
MAGTRHQRLLDITQLPTAAGREHRVVEAVERFVHDHAGCALDRDDAGNLTLSIHDADRSRPPVYLTAHLDHPAFVVERVIADEVVELAFRGGVMADYFPGARVAIQTGDRPVLGTVTHETDASSESPFKHYECELDEPRQPEAGDVAMWAFPPAEVTRTPPEPDGAALDHIAPDAGDLLATNACDDLSAVAAALDTLKRVLAADEPRPDLRLLFTLAEEVGFVGAIGACRLGTIPDSARVLALENSRAFPDAPIGGGPIVRVGDRLSIFNPDLTAQVAAVAEQVAGGPATPTASQKRSDAPAWKWQRKLMAGGACEATVFTAFGLDATCVCLPLGNYHNMADLARVQAGTNDSPPTVAREYIALRDYDALVDLLAACATRLGSDDAPAPITERLDKLWNERRFVLG